MKTEEIVVANLKCDGCATTITKKLLSFKNVKKVVVNNDKNAVLVTYDEEQMPREKITNTLESLGYPEATEKNGLLLQLKSYVSCVIGKVGNLTH